MYKRQLLARLVPAVDRAAPAILQRTQMIAPHSLLHVATGLLALWILVKGPTDGPWRFMPVSYTHLDVYKRQRLVWPCWQAFYCC